MENDYSQLIKKVMNSEIDALQNVEKNIDPSFNTIVDAVLHCEGKIVFMGVGKSGHIGKKLAATFASTGTPSFFVHGTEAIHGDLGMVEKKDLVIAISNSGETQEVLAPIPSLRRIGSKIIALTGNKNSTLAKASDLVLMVKVNHEADDFNLAPSNSSTAALVVGDAIGLTVSHLKGFQEKNFANFHPGGALGRRLLNSDFRIHEKKVNEQ
ncbi:KpsF/GutQ family sugar-phosphate isomerase [Sporolactobacillus sp. KGMB 08714]|uniref:KpsF/GutQ family sugar-phosphate isomerase n=1 Tax=Sporolactobacillus sp. KGMB 08714 TaxID=3064704 RepID=UPI002FBD97FC